MNLTRLSHALASTLLGCVLFAPASVLADENPTSALMGALLADTPLAEDLRELTDEIGGRPTGSVTNLNSVEWGLKKFEAAGVTARKESFSMPARWLEKRCEGRVSGDLSFAVDVVAMPFSVATPKAGTKRPILDVGSGSDEDFENLGRSVKDAFVLVETSPLLDIDGLFEEYDVNVEIERRAEEAGAAGVVYMSSRPEGVLYRHTARGGFDNKQLVLAMERGDAERVLRSLLAGKQLQLWTKVELEDAAAHESYNVIGEIPGSDLADEYVLIGAHLDSWDLGGGANDNGCNVAMMIDIARQMKQLGLTPRRTIRFALWNGEEQGMYGSWGYVQKHRNELDRHVMTGSIDIGSGAITGFFTGGRPEIVDAVDDALEPVEGLGPFELIDIPIVGTDNFDFMLEGVANIVANQDSYNYGPNYHASTDNFDKVDVHQLRINAAIVAAVVCEFANMDVDWDRQGRAEVQALIDDTDLGEQMETFDLMADWESGRRGRQNP